MNDASSRPGARVLAQALARALPGLGAHLDGPWRAATTGLGAANTCFTGQHAVLKVRADAADDARGEAWALRHAPRGTAPRLITHVPFHALREAAALQRDEAACRALDVPAGGVILMERVHGRFLEAPGDEEARATGATLARFHARRSTGPRWRVPSHPSALWSSVQDAAAQVARHRALDGVTLRVLGRAMRVAGRHVARVLDAGLQPRVRALCHGDLRWHNVVFTRQGPVLLDLEHAGVGDPAVDLAFMAARTPLARHGLLCVLDGYLSTRNDRRLLRRMDAVEPLVVLRGALDGVLDLLHVAAGTRAVVGGASAYVEHRRADATDGMERALHAVLDAPLAKRPVLRVGGVATASRSSPARVRVTVDGTAMSGKSLVAAGVAAALGVPHLNTGLLYRLVAWRALLHGWKPHRAADVALCLRDVALHQPRLSADGRLHTRGGRFDQGLNVIPVERVVASWARLPAVRAWAGGVVAGAIPRGGVVLEGRDAGTVLLPGAEVRVFVDAALEERARRLVQRSVPLIRTAGARAMLDLRDAQDMQRDLAPLRRARGMVLLDTTALTPEQGTARVLALIGKRKARP